MDTPVPEEIDQVTVVGAGSMGHGIAQTFATSGYEVTLVDVSAGVLDDALENIAASVDRLGGDPEAVIDRIDTTTDQAAGLADADVMVEAVPEEIELKEDVFAAADEVTPEHAVLATNTSTLPITEIAAATERPERVVGMHFSNPVPLIDLVEVIRGDETSDAVFDVTESLTEAVGKTPVLVEEDVPGFLLNRINYAFWSEALRSIDHDGYDPETVDAAVQRLGFPMGPFEVLDFAGVDVFYLVCQAMQDRGVPVEISETHEELFDDERYGMKTGAGFYDYPEAGAYARVDIPTEQRYEYDPYPMIASAVNAAAWLLANDVATRDDIDEAMRVGMSWPRGPLAFADEYGIDRVVETLTRRHEDIGWQQYVPHPLLERMVDEDRLGVKSGEGFYEYPAESETFGPVEYERRDYYAVVTLSRPGKLNALNEAAWRGLHDALVRAAEDDGVRGLIVRGAGEAFCAGDDIAEMADWQSVDEGAAFFEDVALPAIEAFRTYSGPTVALVDGVATGMGCELALLSDMAVAADGSQFGQPEAQIGALPPIWLTHGSTSVGKKKLLELALTGDLVSASEAADIGLVNYTVSAEQAPDVARELVRSTTASAPGSVASIKDIWHRMEDDLIAAWLDDAIDELTERVHTEEGRHGLSAFLDDSSPRWER